MSPNMGNIQPLLFSASLFLSLGLGNFNETQAQTTAIGDITTSSPLLKDMQGNLLPATSTGQLVIISAVAVNSRDDPVSFVIIMEARDEVGVTQFLQFKSGNVEGNGSIELDVSWKPAKVGNHQLRTFLISNFEKPEILTTVKTSQALITD